MIFTGIITGLSVFAMFYGSIKTVYLAAFCIFIAVLMAVIKHEHSDSVLSIDEISRNSGLSDKNSALKIAASMTMIVLCVVSKNPVTGFSILAISGALLILMGKIEFSTYIRFLSVPMAFIFIGGLAIALNYSKSPMDIGNVKVFSGYLGIGMKSQMQARLVVAKSFGAVSSLYIMSLTTPMSEIIRCLKKVRVPAIVIDLMYLIYRCIFIIYGMHMTMKTAAKSRMGYSGYRRSIKTTAMIYSNLLMRSYMASSRMFDAMMSRCYMGEINFLQNGKKNRE